MKRKLELREETQLDGAIVYWVYLNGKMIEGGWTDKTNAQKYFNEFTPKEVVEVVLETREV